jgi:tape measure domain-containing protein
MAVGAIKVVMDLDDRGFAEKLAKNQAAIKALTATIKTAGATVQQAEGHFGNFGRGMHNFLITAAAVKYLMLDLHQVFLSFPIAVMKTSGEMERLTQLMEGLSTASTKAGRMEEATKGLKYVLDLAQRSPFEVKALTDAFVKFKSAGLDPMNGGLEALTNSVAKFGGNSETMHRASIAIQQMAGKGVISMEELRQQLGEAVPTAMAQMAIAMGMSMSELAAAVKKGTVEANSALSKMFVQMQAESWGSAEAMSNTWVGMISRLETKWELFKVAVGRAGAFESAKIQLQNLLDAFDSTKAAELAQSLGEALKTGIEALVDMVAWIRKWSDELIIAGKVLATVFVMSKIAAFAEGMKNHFAVIQATYTKAAAAAQLAQAQEQANLMQSEMMNQARVMSKIAANEKELASDMARAAAQDVLRNQQLEREIVLNNVLLTNKTVALAEMQAIEQAQILRGLELQLQADKLRMAHKKASDVQMLADAVKTQAQMSGVAIAGLEQEIAAINAAQAARAKGIGTREAEIAVVNTQAASIARLNIALAEEAAMHGKNIAMLEATTLATGAATGAKAAMMSILGSLINPINLAIGAIMLLVYAWDAVTESANAARKAQQDSADFQRNVKLGRASEGDVKTANKRVSEWKEELREDEKLLGELEKQRAAAIQAGAKTTEILDADIASLRNTISTLKQNITSETQALGDATAIVTEQVANQISGALGAKINRSINVYAEQLQTANATLRQKAEEAKALLRTGDTAGAAKIDAQLTNDLRKNTLEFQAARAKVYTDSYEQFNQAIRTGIDLSGKELDAETRAAYKLQAAQLLKLRDETVAGIKRYQAPNVFTASKGDDKKGAKGSIVEDPLVKALEHAQGVMNAAYAKLQSIRDGAPQLADLQQEAFDIIGKLKAGDFNASFKDKSGNVDQAEKSRLAGMTFEQLKSDTSKAAQELVAIVEKMRDAKYYTTAYAMIESATKKAIGAQVEFTEAYERVVSGNQEKQTTGMRSMIGHFAELEQRLQLVGDELERFNKKKAEALAAQAGADLANFVSDRSIKMQEASIALITTERERKEEAYRIETERINQMFQLRVDALEAELGLNEEFYRRLTVMKAEFNASEVIRVKLHAEAMKTPLQKLADAWADTTKNMEDATARWAEAGINEFMKFVETGKFNFKALATSILSDILRIQIQAQAAKAITGIMSLFAGGFGGTAASAVPGSFTGPQFGTFANGGIMTEHGPVPLNKYARGGVANSPQMAMFGEGSMPEAYVPLPDGRSIPVAMAGGVAPQVTVNVINQTGTEAKAEQGSTRFDGRRMILDVVLTAVSQPGSFRDSFKGAMR